MIQVVNQIKDIDIVAWDNLVNDSECSSFFQTRNCYEFYKSLTFIKPIFYAVKSNEDLKGLFVGYMISEKGVFYSYFSRRLIIPGGLLLKKNISDLELHTLLNTARFELKKKAIYIEIRNYKDFRNYKKNLTECNFRYVEHLNYHLKTSSIDVVKKNLSNNIRRQVNLIDKNEISSSEIKNSTDIIKFYEILLNLYKNKIKSPLFPIEFFYNLVNLDIGKIIAIKYKEEIVGGIVLVFHKSDIVYEWFVCGDKSKFANINPSTIATWKGIEFAAENNFKYFDFLGAGSPKTKYGVRDFKSKFGGELVEHGRFLSINNYMLFYIGKTFINIRKRFKI